MRVVIGSTMPGLGAKDWNRFLLSFFVSKKLLTLTTERYYHLVRSVAEPIATLLWASGSGGIKE
jgi:hypothetical protein